MICAEEEKRLLGTIFLVWLVCFVNVSKTSFFLPWQTEIYFCSCSHLMKSVIFRFDGNKALLIIIFMSQVSIPFKCGTECLAI